MASFTYDTLDRRSSKTINGQTQNCLYDGSDIIQESGTVNSVYTHGSGVDEILMRRGSTSEFYQADALGSIIGLMNNNGAVTTGYAYLPYRLKQTVGIASSNPHGFTAREDDGTGLYFYRARYYSPDQKRFIAEDPLEFGGGDSNFYAYVGGNPLTFRDPLGKQQAELNGYQKREQQGMIASFELIKTFHEMKDKNTIGTDQFFHCLAACRATKSSSLQPGDIEGKMAMKEYFWDYPSNLLGQYGRRKLTHSEMIKDMQGDLDVNKLGANCPDGKSCAEQCNFLIPKSAQPFMEKYLGD